MLVAKLFTNSLWSPDFNLCTTEVSLGGIEHQKLASGVQHLALLHAQHPSTPHQLRLTHAHQEGIHHTLARPQAFAGGHLKEEVLGSVHYLEHRTELL